MNGNYEDISLSEEDSDNKRKNYDLNKIKMNSSDFFKEDPNFRTSEIMKKEEKKEEKKEKEKKEKEKSKDNQFLADLDELYGDSGANNNTSKAAQSQSSHSQKDSKLINKSIKKSINKSQNKKQKKKSIDNDIEEIGVNRDDNNNENENDNENDDYDIDDIDEVDKNKENEKDNKTEAEKKLAMEKYLQQHQSKFPINQKKEQVINKPIVEEKSIEENINERNDNKEEDDDYGGFDLNINSETNIQNNQTSSIAQSKKKNKASSNNNNNNSIQNKQVITSDSYNNYLGEFEQSKINEVNKIEEKNNNENNNHIESLIKEVNKEHNKNTKNLENNNINNMNSNNFNIYSNNNLNNIINSNNFINSVGSGDSINVNKIIKNEVGKYDTNIDIKNDYFNNNNINKNIEIPMNNKYPKNFVNLRKININYFSILKPSKNQYYLLKLKNEEALKNARNKIQILECEVKTLKIENEKLLEEINIIHNQKNDNLIELKNNYDNSVKNMELTVLNREKKKFENLRRDMEIKYQNDIIQKQNEIEKIKNDYAFLENRYNELEYEYKKMKDSKENEEQLNDLKSENYRLHAQINEYKNQKNKNFEKNELSLKNKYNENNDKKSDTMKIYEQILNEREINTQEKLLNNYLKEIKKLNEEIIFLKSINSLSNKPPSKQANNISNENILLNNNQSAPKMNNYIINPSLQESAEKQIKKLQNFLLPSSSDNPLDNKLIILEKELTRLQNKETPNEISFTNYINVMKQLKVPLTSNELIEIFNNFPRIKGDRIRMNDFINALNSKSPSAFFLQSDPSYLNELESKLIKAQNRIKELEKFIIVNNNENEEFKEQLKKTLDENKILKNKINELNSQILQYFLFREEKNISNPDVIQMKEKMRTMEIKSKTMDNELNEKLGKYEKRIENLQKTYEDEKNKILKEKDGFKEQINKLKNEKEKDKNEYDKKEILLKTEINQLNEKLQKYKKNYNILSTKNEMNKREKEKILNSFKEKGFDPEQIMTFVNNSANIQEILNKITELERKNLNREEIYKRICMEVNKTQVNKELEKARLKYEEEKRGLLKIIAQKNNELNSIKAEFFDIMNDLEKLKANKFK